MIALLMNPKFWAAIALVFVAGFFTGCQEEAKRHAETMARIEMLGKAAHEHAIAVNKFNRKRKEDSDATYKSQLGALVAENQRLRSLASRSLLPGKPSGSKCPEGQTCFDTALLDAALQRYREGVRAIAEECSEVALGLHTAQVWAQKEFK